MMLSHHIMDPLTADPDAKLLKQGDMGNYDVEDRGIVKEERNWRLLLL
jgi:hypothetical protein